MHIYDTIIIGSGYVSVGFALAKGNCIICEKSELCDTHFGASLCCNKWIDYAFETDEGKHLIDIFNGMNLIKNGYVNVNAFECALSKYVVDRKIDVILKCRIIDAVKDNGIYTVTVATNNGLEKIYAENIKDFSNIGKDYITVQFVSSNIEHDFALLESVFGKVNCEKTFYNNRYALFIPSNGFDINTLKLDIYEKWHKSGTSAKILHVSSSMFSLKSVKLCDEMFDCFLEAFEYGVKEALKSCQ